MSKVGEGGADNLSYLDFEKENFDEYYRRSRYIPFKKCIEVIKNHPEIESGLDIATSSGHFVYLANLENLNFEGSDILVPDNVNNIFLKKFNKECIYKDDFDNLINLEKKYDIITNFHLTHIFDKNSLYYLLQVLSCKTKFCFIHISEENIRECEKYDFIEIIEILDFNINMNGVKITKWILLKFTKKSPPSETKRFFRPNYYISLI